MTPLAAWITVGTALLAFFGGFVGHVVSSRKNKNDFHSAMIDQIQEERNRLDGLLKEQREYHDRQMIEQQERHDKSVKELNVRITGFYADKSHSRRYIADLEADNAALRMHISLGKPPPPPTEIPKPPDGYIP